MRERTSELGSPPHLDVLFFCTGHRERRELDLKSGAPAALGEAITN